MHKNNIILSHLNLNTEKITYHNLNLLFIIEFLATIVDGIIIGSTGATLHPCSIISHTKFAAVSPSFRRGCWTVLTTLGSDRASSKGYIVRWVEAPSNKLLTTAFEASLESVTVTCRLSVDSKIAGIAMEHRNPKVSEGRHRGQGGRQYMHLSLW